jgi:hypothetical protein
VLGRRLGKRKVDCVAVKIRNDLRLVSVQTLYVLRAELCYLGVIPCPAPIRWAS